MANVVRASLPGPATFELHLQRHTQERSDRDDDREHAGTAKRRRNGDGSDNVGGHEQLKPEQDRLTEGLAEAPIAIAAVAIAGGTAAEAGEGDGRRDEDTRNHCDHAGPVERLPDELDRVPERHLRCLPERQSAKQQTPPEDEREGRLAPPLPERRPALAGGEDPVRWGACARGLVADAESHDYASGAAEALNETPIPGVDAAWLWRRKRRKAPCVRELARPRRRLDDRQVLVGGVATP